MEDLTQAIVDSAADAMALYLFRQDVTSAYNEVRNDVTEQLRKVLPEDLTFTVRCDETTNPPDSVNEGLLCAVVEYSVDGRNHEVKVIVRLPRDK